MIPQRPLARGVDPDPLAAGPAHPCVVLRRMHLHHVDQAHHHQRVGLAHRLPLISVTAIALLSAEAEPAGLVAVTWQLTDVPLSSACRT